MNIHFFFTSLTSAKSLNEICFKKLWWRGAWKTHWVLQRFFLIVSLQRKKAIMLNMLGFLLIVWFFSKCIIKCIQTKLPPQLMLLSLAFQYNFLCLPALSSLWLLSSVRRLSFFGYFYYLFVKKVYYSLWCHKFRTITFLLYLWYFIYLMLFVFGFCAMASIWNYVIGF